MQEIPQDTKEQIALIRKIIKQKIPTVSVRNGRGTAWGWVEISGSGEFHDFTEAERTALKELGLTPGGNFAVISPEDRKFWLRKWLGIPEPPPKVEPEKTPEQKQAVFEAHKRQIEQTTAIIDERGFHVLTEQDKADAKRFLREATLRP